MYGSSSSDVGSIVGTGVEMRRPAAASVVCVGFVKTSQLPPSSYLSTFFDLMMFRLLTAAASTASVSLPVRCSIPATILPTNALRLLSDATSAGSASINDNDTIKVGTVKNFGINGGFGFIIPDGVGKHAHDAKDLIFIHRNDIKAAEPKPGEARYFPTLKKGQRVQYKVGPAPDGAVAGRAYDLTQEGGEYIPHFHNGYLENYTKKQKAIFGDEVYEIFTTSKDQKELEMKIVAAFDRAKGNIERQTAKVTAAGGGDAKGEE